MKVGQQELHKLLNYWHAVLIAGGYSNSDKEKLAMTMDVIKQAIIWSPSMIVHTVLNAELPYPYQWGDDAVECFEVGKMQAGLALEDLFFGPQFPPEELDGTIK